MAGSDDPSQLTLEVDQVDHLFPFGTAGKEKHVFLQNTTTNWRPALLFFYQQAGVSKAMDAIHLLHQANIGL